MDRPTLPRPADEAKVGPGCLTRPMSIRLALTRGLLRTLPRHTATAESLRASLPARGAAAGAGGAVRRVAVVRETAVGGWPVTLLTPRRGASGTHVVYAHGGAYVRPLSRFHWSILTRLVRSGASVSVPHYGLAPDHGPDEALELMAAVHRRERARHDRVVVAGDSAGGGLALAHAMRERDAGHPAADALVLFAPWVDVTLADPAAAALEHRDHLLGVEGLREAGRLWAGDRDPRDPTVSPLYGDLGGLPPVFTYQGDRDVLLPDAKSLTRGVQAAGGRAELRIAAGGFHVHVAAGWTPEARRTFAHVDQVLRG